MGLDSAQHCLAISHFGCRRSWGVSFGASDGVIVMLEQLVKEIRAGGTLETGALAARLGTTPQLIEAMLDHLQRTGLIQTYVNCVDGCLGCSLQDSCKRPGPGAIRLWQTVNES